MTDVYAGDLVNETPAFYSLVLSSTHLQLVLIKNNFQPSCVRVCVPSWRRKKTIASVVFKSDSYMTWPWQMLRILSFRNWCGMYAHFDKTDRPFRSCGLVSDNNWNIGVAFEDVNAQLRAVCSSSDIGVIKECDDLVHCKLLNNSVYCWINLCRLIDHCECYCCIIYRRVIEVFTHVFWIHLRLANHNKLASI